MPVVVYGTIFFGEKDEVTSFQVLGQRTSQNCLRFKFCTGIKIQNEESDCYEADYRKDQGTFIYRETATCSPKIRSEYQFSAQMVDDGSKFILAGKWYEDNELGDWEWYLFHLVGTWD